MKIQLQISRTCPYFSDAKLQDAMDNMDTHIIHVCENRKLFSTFQKQVRHERLIGCSFASIYCPSNQAPSRTIGQRTTRRQIKNDRQKHQLEVDDSRINDSKDPLICSELNIKVIGLAVSWSVDTIYFLSFLLDHGE